MKPLSLLMALCLMVLLSACSIGGDNDDNDATPEPSATEPATSSTPTASDDTQTTPDSTASIQSTQPSQPTTDGTPAASPPPASTPATGIGDPPATIVAVGDVLDDPESFIDLPVTLSADVAATVDDVALTITDTGAEAPLLVVGPPGVIPTDLEPAAYVRVAGVVRRFEQAEIELAIGAGLDDDAFDAFAGEPVLVASEVRIGLVSVDGLLADPGSYTDRRITVTGPLSDIISPQAFTLEPEIGNAGLLVVATFRAIAPSIAADNWVRATGTVRILDPDNDNLPAEITALLDDAFAEYIGGPVVVLDLLEILSEGTTTTTGEIVNDPATFAAQPVIVSDTIVSLLAAQAFTVDADGQQLLVVAREGTVPSDLTSGAVVLVNGTVSTFTVAGADAIVWEALGINPADPALAAFDGQPAIIADRIDLVAAANGQ